MITMDQPEPHAPLPEVFSLDEIARAANVPVSRVEEMLEMVDEAVLPTLGDRRTPFIAWDRAVLAVAALSRARGPLAVRRPFGLPVRSERRPRLPLAGSGAVHVAVVLAIFALTAAGLAPQAPFAEVTLAEPSARLVFVATPGPGGGGGGGGIGQPAPPSRAERAGSARQASPVPPPRPPAPVSAPPEVEPLATAPLMTIVAPVASLAADEIDRTGVLEAAPLRMEVASAGPGDGGGAGSGTGAGLGEGLGDGIGPGSGGGIGGGPYRPGSGVTPPRLLREIKPDYTESARVQAVEGEVVLEIVVRHDGSVDDVRVVERLGFGLDERAVAAVRQWVFAPAERHGTPVDVLVEVALEFRLR